MTEAIVLALVGVALGGFAWAVLHPRCPECGLRSYGPSNTTRHTLRCPYCDYWEALDDSR